MSEFSPGLPGDDKDVCSLEKRIAYAKKTFQQKTRPSEKLSSKDLFASDGLTSTPNVSLKGSKIARTYCHDLFDLSELHEGKNTQDLSKVRFKQTYPSVKYKDRIQERIILLLSAIWGYNCVTTLELKRDLATFGCLDEHRGPINKILATLTAMLLERQQEQDNSHGKGSSGSSSSSGK
jgi:hypothetical protein